MIRGLAAWRAESWAPDDAIPVRPGFGARYPWRLLLDYAGTQTHRDRVSGAVEILGDALRRDERWRVGISAGKDSTALAVLLSEAGADAPGLSVKDDLDYPGELAYVHALARHCSSDVEILSPDVSLAAFLRDSGTSLLSNLHNRTAELSSRWFYGLLDAHRARVGYTGVFLGLRAEESPGRAKNAAQRGPIYQRRDGLTIAQPLAGWRTEDVHAFLLTRGVPILPVYLCVDLGEDWRALRKSWWVVGGAPAARLGHYTWLRRWWPAQWAKACEIDAAVGSIS